MLTYHGMQDIPKLLYWEAVQMVLQRFPSLAYFSVGFKDTASFRWLLEALLRGDILSDLAGAEKLRVIDMAPPDDLGWHWQHWNQHHIFSAPKEYTQGKTTITLNSTQRVEWLMRRTVNAQEDYLKELFSSRSAHEGDIGTGSPGSSSSEGGSPVKEVAGELENLPLGEELEK